MIVHLDANKITLPAVQQHAQELFATYYLQDNTYVFVLGAKYKEVPEVLLPYARENWVMDTDMQLASRTYREALRSFTLGDLPLDGDHTWIVAGPCSVETPEQIDGVAKRLCALGVRVLRAGCYKPRTSPYSFQGLGKEGLRLLTEVREKYGLRIITEVRDATHVDEVLEATDIVQIGTKAMFDQGILRACAAADKPVLIKRGFGASLEELVKASEFILSQGNHKVILCERGIRSHEQRTRFTLDLCGVAFLQEHINLPIFIDPSHAMGYAYGVGPLTRAAVAMGVEGLLIEVHPDPPAAWSDAAQQLNVDEFASLYDEIRPIAAAVRRTLT